MQRLGYLCLLLVLLACGLPHAASAQPGGPAPFATLKSAVIEPVKAGAGQKATLAITLTVNEGFHINANKPDDKNSFPTVLSVTAPKTSGIVVGTPVFPSAKTIPVKYSPTPIKGYQDTVVIKVPLTIKPNAKPGAVTLTGVVHAQGCNATTCFPPASFPLTATLTVTGAKK